MTTYATLDRILSDIRATELKATKLRRQRWSELQGLLNDGATVAEIAEHCGVTRQAVYQWIKD